MDSTRLLFLHEFKPFMYIELMALVTYKSTIHGSVNIPISLDLSWDARTNSDHQAVFWALGLEAHVSKRAEWFNEEVHKVTWHGRVTVVPMCCVVI